MKNILKTRNLVKYDFIKASEYMNRDRILKTFLQAFRKILLGMFLMNTKMAIEKRDIELKRHRVRQVRLCKTERW